MAEDWSRNDVLAVLGGGTMGAGIAALACERGVTTILCDASPALAAAARERVEGQLARRRQRGKVDAAAEAAALGRLTVSAELEAAAPAALAIEAVPERLELKRSLFERLAAIAPDAVLASNTSSLPIADLAAGSAHAGRLLGLHFFNPPGAIALVELVATPATGAAALARARALAMALGRQPVTVADGPGFLVNRCARPYYLEALRTVAAGAAEPAAVDAALEAEGFPLGPFRLIDLVGIDVNLAVARSLWEQAGHEPRWRPSPIQEAMVAAGRLGRKGGGGFYDADGAPLPLPAGSAAGPAVVPLGPEEIVTRVAAQLVNEAHFALEAGVAAAADVDPAMTAALRWPRGPLSWGEELGRTRLVALLDELAGPGADPVYRVAPSLRAA
ncbi:MAG: 3-hydroxybutyryl-CoA dehydrogenase [Actinobacteria bacterium]|nr:3-hydroxybutyryl-CoA dehydrogenase [Actinomycetota bacterium]